MTSIEHIEQLRARLLCAIIARDANFASESPDNLRRAVDRLMAVVRINLVSKFCAPDADADGEMNLEDTAFLSPADIVRGTEV